MTHSSSSGAASAAVCENGHAGVVEDQPERLRRPRLDLGRERHLAAAVAHVESAREHRAGDRLLRLAQVVLVPVADRDGGSEACEPLRHRAAHAGPRARDDGRAAGDDRSLCHACQLLCARGRAGPWHAPPRHAPHFGDDVQAGTRPRRGARRRARRLRDRRLRCPVDRRRVRAGFEAEGETAPGPPHDRGQRRPADPLARVAARPAARRRQRLRLRAAAALPQALRSARRPRGLPRRERR